MDFRGLQARSFELSNDGMLLHELTSSSSRGHFLAANEAVCKMLGYTAEELQRLTPFDIMAPEDGPRASQEGGQLQQAGTLLHQRQLRAKDGHRVPVEINSRTFEEEGRTLVLSALRDLRNRPQAEAVRAEVDRPFLDAIESLQDGFLALDSQWRVTYANRKSVADLGLPVGFAGRTIWELCPWLQGTDQERLYRQVMAKRVSDVMEGRAVRSDRWYRLACSPHASGISVLASDISARRAVEQALEDSEERFRVAFRTSPDSINLNRLEDGLYLEVNEGFSRLVGWSANEVRGRTSLDLELWDDPADRTRLVAGLKRDGYVENLEAFFRAKDGRRIPALMSARLLTLRGEQVILSITRDISDRKRAEEERNRLQQQVQQAQKLESIGRLAGGVAHDFNNLLTVILSCGEVLRHDLEEGSAAAPEDVREILTAAERARDLTRRLLAFARKQILSPVPVDLGQVVRNCEKLLHHVLGEDITLTVDLAPDLWSTRCDPGQIEQVIMNLAVNARDAMPGGGALAVLVVNECTEEGAMAGPDRPAGEWVRLTVRDTGCGMSEEVRAHVFEPFFTTKAVGSGTGLGLAIVHGVVSQAGGTIRVDSAPGRGTTFHLFFPRTLEAPVPVAGAAPAPQGGTETILLVEDDAQVREVALRSLLRAGYKVLAAKDGSEALEMETMAGPGLDLLVTDVIMPGSNGREVADAMRRRRPGLRVLFVSGHADDLLSRTGVLDPGIELLSKPFTPESLLSRIRQVLDRR